MVLQAPPRGRFDWALLGAMAALITLGLLMVYTATVYEDHEPFRKQAYSCAAALAVLALVVAVPYQIWSNLSLPLWLGSLVLLAIVLVAGTEVRGSNSWLAFGPVRFQPAEAAKFTTALLLSTYAASRQGFGLTPRILAGMGLIVAAPVGLILMQPDLGSTLPFFPLLGVAVFLSGVRWKTIIAVMLLGVLCVPAFWLLLKPYQKERVMIFLEPGLDPKGVGWQVLQSRIAVGSGGLLGKGLGEGSQAQLNFLPDRHTDFIFSVLAEEIGFAGTASALLLYGILLYGCVASARAARDRLGLFLCMTVAALLGSQIIINIGVILGLMPTAGIPLPLMSYGGSSLVTSVGALGLVLNVRMRCLVN
ncbi:MAG: rod shape-determining protein RodA [Acidobacteria bacterium]|nr:rod shape-determining protein RodA [Acidobacteriota bacterium]